MNGQPLGIRSSVNDFLRFGCDDRSTARLRQAAQAPGYPDRPIRLIVPRFRGVVRRHRAPTGPAGHEDAGAVYIDNMGGAGGVIGAASSWRRRHADGNYVAVRAPTANWSSAHCSGRLHDDPVRELRADRHHSATAAPLIVVHYRAFRRSQSQANASPTRQQNRDSMNYGSRGPPAPISNPRRRACFKGWPDLPDIVYIPYKGGAPALVGR